VASLRVYRRLIGATIRGQLHYRASFLLQVFSSFISTFVELLAIIILFSRFHEMAGWHVGEVALLYGLVSIAWAVTDMAAGGLEQTGLLIRSGDFDRLLTRPVPALLQVLASDFQPRRLGRATQGALAILLAQLRLGLALRWTLAKALVFLAALASTGVVFFSVLVIAAAVTFWTVENSEAQNIFSYGGVELGSYPIPIYSAWLRNIFLYLVPLGLTSYEPALYILGKPDPLGLPGALRFTAPLVAALFLALALGCWRLGLRHYQSTGS
jgi:ABC-2 type transport system permease protein